MEKALIVYWSGTGNTQAMANAIAKGIETSGLQVDLRSVSESPDISGYDRIAFGCPAMGAENLEESEFDPYFTDIESSLANKKVALFGSYGWGGGEWMETWQERVAQANGNLFEQGLIFNDAPGPDALTECESFGARFAKY